MNEDTLIANVQYGDYDGTIAADRRDRSTLTELAEKYGVDVEDNFVFGAEFFIGEVRAGKLPSVRLSFLAVKKEVGHSVTAIEEYLENNAGVLPYVTFDAEISLEEFFLCFKRFNLVLKERYIKNVNLYKLQERY